MRGNTKVTALSVESAYKGKQKQGQNKTKQVHRPDIYTYCVVLPPCLPLKLSYVPLRQQSLPLYSSVSNFHHTECSIKHNM